MIDIKTRQAAVFAFLLYNDNEPALKSKSSDYILEKFRSVQNHNCPEQMLHPILLTELYSYYDTWNVLDDEYKAEMKEWGLDIGLSAM